MDSKEYKQKRDFANAEIERQKEILSDLNAKFIQEHKEFEIGDKVKVTFQQDWGLNAGQTTEDIGFICRISITKDYRTKEYKIHYGFFKCKKDGTPSQHIFSEILNTIIKIEKI